jgi:hypothetical protein
MHHEREKRTDYRPSKVRQGIVELFILVGIPVMGWVLTTIVQHDRSIATLEYAVFKKVAVTKEPVRPRDIWAAFGLQVPEIFKEVPHEKAQ